MDNQGYLNMCGHATIGLCTTVVELGLIAPATPRTAILIDTPAGRVSGYAIIEEGQVSRAGFQNVPAFCLGTQEQVTVDGLGSVKLGIAYGGNFFAIVPAETVGLDISIQNMSRIRALGRQIKKAANQQLKVQHPLRPQIAGVDIVTFYGPSEQPQATYKNVHVFANGQVDRSPGGTGTSAMLAYLMARNEIEQQQTIVAQGIAGGLFEGKIIRSWQEQGVIFHTPEISGRAYLTGVHHFVLNPQDPMGYLPRSV
jgi:proline racemase/trans-L-3-hydroxyproline dehydratase